jgi:serine/threonine protein kinase
MQLLNGIYSKKVTFAKDISETSKDFIKRCLEINEEDRMSWDEAFEHRLLKENKGKPALMKELFLPENK